MNTDKKIMVRPIIMVIDSMGIGAMPDCKDFGGA